MCSRLPASGLLRPEARWPDKVLFSAEKSGALRAKAASRLWPAGRRFGTSLVPLAEALGLGSPGGVTYGCFLNTVGSHFAIDELSRIWYNVLEPI